MKIKRFTESLDDDIYYKGTITHDFTIKRSDFLYIVDTAYNKDWVESKSKVEVLYEYLKARLTLFEHKVNYIAVDKDGKPIDEDQYDKMTKFNL